MTAKGSRYTPTGVDALASVVAFTVPVVAMGPTSIIKEKSAMSDPVITMPIPVAFIGFIFVLLEYSSVNIT
jgi:hypothetical protein